MILTPPIHVRSRQSARLRQHSDVLPRCLNLRVQLRLPGEYGGDELEGGLFLLPESVVKARVMRDGLKTARTPFKEHR